MDTTPAAPAAGKRILTWHVHGKYLYALTQVPHEWVIPVHDDGRPGYGRLGNKIPWGANVREIPADQIKHEEFDCVIYQSQSAYETDAAQLLTPAQRALPSIYIEHDPPRPYPVDTKHCFRHDNGIPVHVTHYNALNWDAGDMPTRVIEHGVPVDSTLRYSGELERGITVINGLKKRGRRMGADLFQWSRERVPLDLIGIPVVGVAATELPTVIVNGKNGFVHTDKTLLVDVMRQLMDEPDLARSWGEAGRRTAVERFNMDRYINDWLAVIDEVTGGRSPLWI